MLRRFRNMFFAGLIVLAPVWLTFYILAWFFNFADGFLRGYVTAVIGYQIPGLGLILTVGIILLIGFLASNLLGRRLIAFAELLILKTPLARNIYQTVKQIVDAFMPQRNTPFSKVVLVEYPRRGIYAIGFLTGTTMGEVQEKTREEVMNVFLPTTPNPTSGFLLLIPKDDVVVLDMTVEDGLKLVISGGVITPPWPRNNGRNNGQIKKEAV